MKKPPITILLIPLFAVLLAATVFFVRFIDEKNAEKTQVRFEAEQAKLSRIIRDNLEDHASVLAGLRGLFAASEEVNRAEFREYVRSLNLRVRFPAFMAVSYAERVPAGLRDVFVESVRKDASLDPAGYPDFRIFPGGFDGDAYVIKYTEPPDSGILGFDVAGEPERRRTLDLARDLDATTATGAITLLNGSGGFLVVAPVYRNGVPHELLAERREAIRGYVIGVFEGERFIDGLFRNEALGSGLRIEVLLGKDDPARLGAIGDESVTRGGGLGDTVKDETYRAYGQTWHARFRLLQDLKYSEDDRLLPLIIGGFGLVASVLICATLYFLMTSRSRAIRLAAEMTRNLEAATQKLEEQKNALDVLIENLPVGVLLLKAPDGEPIMSNRIGMTMQGRGLDREARIGEFAERYDIIREDGTRYPENELPSVIALREGRLAVRSDVCIRRPDGSVINLRALAAPIKDARGRIASAVLVMDDITKEREIERQKTEFLYVASHQLRTPLTAVKWLMEMLLRGDAGRLGKEQGTFVRQAYESNGRMIALVNDLLSVSRIDSGVMEVAPKATDAGALASSVLDEVRPLAKAKKQKLAADLPRLPDISIDPRLVRQVFVNLLSNAVKYTPAGGAVRLRAKTEGGEVRFEVSDSGIGIPEAQQGSIFRKFFRAENALGSGEEGTGLGLYVCRQIVELSGGRVGFESRPGKGSTFWFTLPLKGSQPRKGTRTVS